MRARLKRLHSPDVDLDSYWPGDQVCFGFLLQALIGPEESTAEESFDFVVCTPKWLSEHYSLGEAVFGRYLLIVFEYDLAQIRSKIECLCATLSAPDWPALACKIGEYGKWEFQNYVPNSSV